jgi:hypothetical protein
VSEITYDAPPGAVRAFMDTLLGETDAHGWPLNVSSQAAEASHIIKSGAGRLFGFTVYNSNVGAQFIQLHDAQTLPADGAVPVFVCKVATVVDKGVFWGDWGRFFDRGIVICNSSTFATKTIGAADCFFDAQYL